MHIRLEQGAEAHSSLTFGSYLTVQARYTVRVTELAAAVCSVAPTQRGRFFWAAWWTGAPRYKPFRKPDACGGGARSLEDALAAAQQVAGRHLLLVEPYWAHAVNRMQRGEAPQPPPDPTKRRTREATQPPPSAWSLLGLPAGASLEDVKRAYRKRALETHPDRGGDEAAFRAVQRAYERLTHKLGRARKHD